MATKIQKELTRIGNINGDMAAVDQLMTYAKSLENLAEDKDVIDKELLKLGPAKTNIISDVNVFKDIQVNNAADTWHFVHPVTVLQPKSLKGVVNAVEHAEKNNKLLRGLGARHSFSTISQTDHFYLELSKTHPYDPDRHDATVDLIDQTSILNLKQTVDKSNHFDAPGGMQLFMVNHILCPDNPTDKKRFGEKRIYNMGGGDVQTIAGAFSGGTHGSGGVFSAYHDMIRSILIVGSGGKVYRVEPKGGITSPTKHEQFYTANPNNTPVELIQDDDKFYSAVVSMGCFGIIYSAIMEVTDMTLLHEEVEYKKSGWTTALKNKIKNGLLPDKEEFHYVYLNPYKLKRNANNSVSIKKTLPTSIPGKMKKVIRRKFWPTVFGKSNLAASIIQLIANNGLFPKRRFIETAIKAQNDNVKKGGGYTDLSYKVWNAGTGTMVTIGVAIEMAVPVQKAPEILDFLIQFLESLGQKGLGYYLNAYISLRFARASKVYLANNYEEYNGEKIKEWCHIELLRVNSKNEEMDSKELELFQHIQQMLYFKGARPHWGLNFKFPFTEDVLDTLYPKFGEWLKSYLFFNSTGVFDNEFSRSANLRMVAERRAGN